MPYISIILIVFFLLCPLVDCPVINPFLVVSDASPVDGRWTYLADFYHVRYGIAERTCSADHFRQRSICQIRLPTINRRYWGQHDGLALYPSIMQDCISTDRVAHTRPTASQDQCFNRCWNECRLTEVIEKRVIQQSFAVLSSLLLFNYILT